MKKFTTKRKNSMEKCLKPLKNTKKCRIIYSEILNLGGCYGQIN